MNNVWIRSICVAATAMGLLAMSPPANGQIVEYEDQQLAGANPDEWAGVSVALDGDTLVMGVSGYAGWTGKAEVYEWSGSAWQLAATAQPFENIIEALGQVLEHSTTF